jgi:hypothetical protein
MSDLVQDTTFSGEGWALGKVEERAHGAVVSG